MLELGLLLLSLGIILLGAEVFTNGIEWLGRLLRLSEGAVGSILAAVGTALPETMIPIIAIFSGKEGSNEIGIGAILGAPFMLGTLALGVTGLAVVVFRRKRSHFPYMNINIALLKRDLIFFMIIYSIAILAAFIPIQMGRLAIAALLVLAYIYYVYKTLQGQPNNENGEHLSPLYLSRKKTKPSLGLVITQLSFALGLIIFGASLFVDIIREIAALLQVPSFILAMIIAPIATELPEKFNSIIWVRADKDTLALGNITGAMVFQSSLIPALGIAMTDWILTPLALFSSFLVLCCVGLIFWKINSRGYVTPYLLLWGAAFYLVFVAVIIFKVIA